MFTRICVVELNSSNGTFSSSKYTQKCNNFSTPKMEEASDRYDSKLFTICVHTDANQTELHWEMELCALTNANANASIFPIPIDSIRFDRWHLCVFVCVMCIVQTKDLLHVIHKYVCCVVFELDFSFSYQPSAYTHTWYSNIDRHVVATFIRLYLSSIFHFIIAKPLLQNAILFLYSTKRAKNNPFEMLRTTV